MLSGMDQGMTDLERAFQLARSGRVAELTDIITSLKRDGYSASQIEGPLLKRQLTDLIKAARAAGRAPPDRTTHAGSKQRLIEPDYLCATRGYQRCRLFGRE